MTTTTTMFDTSKLSARDRRSFEAGMKLVRQKMLMAKVAKLPQHPGTDDTPAPAPRAHALSGRPVRFHALTSAGLFA